MVNNRRQSIPACYYIVMRHQCKPVVLEIDTRRETAVKGYYPAANYEHARQILRSFRTVKKSLRSRPVYISDANTEMDWNALMKMDPQFFEKYRRAARRWHGE